MSKARESHDRLLYSSYPTLISRAKEAGAFIHYDVAARNFIIKEHRAYLIDFDYCCCDLPLTDLTRLWKRSFKQGENYTSRIEAIIKGYRQHRTIRKEEFDVLYALLLFPQKHWRIAHRYFTDKQKNAIVNHFHRYGFRAYFTAITVFSIRW
jgi:spore coat protein I